MDDQQRNDKAADERIPVYADKAADGELTDDEMSDATGGRLRGGVSKNPDEDAGPDSRRLGGY